MYSKSMAVIKAEESISLSRISDFPHIKEDSRERYHSKLISAASIDDNRKENSLMTTAEVIGFFNKG